ncbi:MAG TPA: anti-sigma factor [Thermoleophilaceae bacterium]|nr:anti-sigma factor [Thermoleophilaceae bacterium]
MSVERHDIQQENVGAYLLGALTDVEERAFVRHLDECPVCSDEVARLRPAADALPRSVTPVTPPPELKVSLMKVVETEARERSGGRAGARRARPLAALRQRLSAGGESLASMRPSLALVGASFLLLVGMLTGYAVTQVTEGGDDARALAAKVDKTRVPNATASLKVLGADSEKSGILRVHGLPPLEEDSTYQVWVKRGQEVISASLFTVGQDGDGAAAVSQDLDGADAVMVTREPAGGARAPSEEPLLSVRL